MNDSQSSSLSHDDANQTQPLLDCETGVDRWEILANAFPDDPVNRKRIALLKVELDQQHRQLKTLFDYLTLFAIAGLGLILFFDLLIAVVGAVFRSAGYDLHSRLGDLFVQTEMLRSREFWLDAITESLKGLLARPLPIALLIALITLRVAWVLREKRSWSGRLLSCVPIWGGLFAETQLRAWGLVCGWLQRHGHEPSKAKAIADQCFSNPRIAKANTAIDRGIPISAWAWKRWAVADFDWTVEFRMRTRAILSTGVLLISAVLLMLGWRSFSILTTHLLQDLLRYLPMAAMISNASPSIVDALFLPLYYSKPPRTPWDDSPTELPEFGQLIGPLCYWILVVSLFGIPWLFNHRERSRVTEQHAIGLQTRKHTWLGFPRTFLRTILAATIVLAFLILSVTSSVDSTNLTLFGGVIGLLIYYARHLWLSSTHRVVSSRISRSIDAGMPLDEGVFWSSAGEGIAIEDRYLTWLRSSASKSPDIERLRESRLIESDWQTAALRLGEPRQQARRLLEPLLLGDSMHSVDRLMERLRTLWTAFVTVLCLLAIAITLSFFGPWLRPLMLLATETEQARSPFVQAIVDGDFRWQLINWMLAIGTLSILVLIAVLLLRSTWIGQSIVRLGNRRAMQRTLILDWLATLADKHESHFQALEQIQSLGFCAGAKFSLRTLSEQILSQNENGSTSAEPTQLRASWLRNARLISKLESDELADRSLTSIELHRLLSLRRLRIEEASRRRHRHLRFALYSVVVCVVIASAFSLIDVLLLFVDHLA